MCKDCVSYGLYKMITSGEPFYYSGDIPCKRCKHFSMVNDGFIPRLHESKKPNYDLVSK